MKRLDVIESELIETKEQREHNLKLAIIQRWIIEGCESLEKVLLKKVPDKTTHMKKFKKDMQSQQFSINFKRK